MSQKKLTDSQVLRAIEKFPIMAQWGRDGIEEFAELLQYKELRLQEQLNDEELAFDHANEVVGKLEAQVEALQRENRELIELFRKFSVAMATELASRATQPAPQSTENGK